MLKPSPDGGISLPTDRMRDLCAKIIEEKNPEQLRALVEQLMMQLSSEQDNIKENIRSQVFGIGKTNAAGN